MAAASRDQYSHFMSAVSEYRAAEQTAGGLADPAGTTIQRTIKIRLVRAELISDVPRLRDEALRWLRDQRLKVDLDCCFRRQRRPWPIRIMAWASHSAGQTNRGLSLQQRMHVRDSRRDDKSADWTRIPAVCSARRW